MTSKTLKGNANAKELRIAAGDYLRALREAAGLTQLEIAKAVGFPYYASVSQIERGVSRVPPERMEAWAEALGADHRAFGKRLLMYYDPATWAVLFGPRPIADSKPTP